jgi:hypothetical protein
VRLVVLEVVAMVKILMALVAQALQGRETLVGLALRPAKRAAEAAGRVAQGHRQL